MKTLFNYVTILSIATTLFACSNSDDFINESVKNAANVEIVSLSDYLPSSRCDGVDIKVLKFKDKEAYDKTVAHLKDMDENQRIEYFSNIGFDGAYTMLRRADAELEAIFDNDDLDSCAFYKEIAAYIDKYDDIFRFYKEEETDVTPNLKFEDDNLSLVGTTDGYVVIGNELLGASTLANEPTGPIQVPNDIIKTCEVSVKNGKYTSYLSLGRIEDHFAFKTQTYRKKFLSTKYDNNVTHIGGLSVKEIGVENSGFTTTVHAKGKVTCKLPYYLHSKQQTWKVTFSDFYSSSYPDNKVTKVFDNITMK